MCWSSEADGSCASVLAERTHCVGPLDVWSVLASVFPSMRAWRICLSRRMEVVHRSLPSEHIGSCALVLAKRTHWKLCIGFCRANTLGNVHRFLPSEHIGSCASVLAERTHWKVCIGSCRANTLCWSSGRVVCFGIGLPEHAHLMLLPFEAYGSCASVPAERTHFALVLWTCRQFQHR